MAQRTFRLRTPSGEEIEMAVSEENYQALELFAHLENLTIEEAFVTVLRRGLDVIDLVLSRQIGRS